MRRPLLPTASTLESARRPDPGLLHCFDCGAQYARGDYVPRLECVAAKIRLAAEGNRSPKARCERLLKALTHEEGYLPEWWTDAEAEATIA